MSDELRTVIIFCVVVFATLIISDASSGIPSWPRVLITVFSTLLGGLLVWLLGRIWPSKRTHTKP